MSGRQQSAIATSHTQPVAETNPRDRCLRNLPEDERVTTYSDRRRKMASDNIEGATANDDTKDINNDKGIITV